VEDAHGHAIAGQGGVGFLGENLQGRGAGIARTTVRLLEHHEGGAAGTELDAPDHLAGLEPGWGRDFRRERPFGQGENRAGFTPDLFGPEGAVAQLEPFALELADESAGHQAADIMSQQNLLLFVQIQLEGQFMGIGGTVSGLPQMGEKAFA
jgi:hypothetical protein